MDFLDSDSSDDEIKLDDYVGKNGLLFLIDFRKNMLKINEKTNKTHLRSCLDVYRNVLIEMGRTGKTDLVGLCLIGTERGTCPSKPIMANIQPLEIVSVPRVKEIDDIILDNFATLVNKYGRGSDSELNLVQIVNGSMKLFLEFRKKVYSRNLVIMTADDDPLSSNLKSAHSARKQASKLGYASFDLTVVGCSSDFNPNKFYNELIALARGEVKRDWTLVNRVKTLDQIDHHFLKCLTKLSRTYRDLHFGHNLSVPISICRIYKEPIIKFKKEVVKSQQPDDASEAGTSSEMTKNNTKTPPTKVPLKDRVYPFVGGRTIRITKAELEKANLGLEVGLTVIGFVKTEKIPRHLSIKPPRLIIPNYFSKQGTDFFGHFLNHCLNKKLSMLAWYKYNAKSSITMTVSHPMTERADLRGNIRPPGFCMVTLPFADNFKEPEVRKCNCNPSEKQLEAARNIVKKLTVPFHPENFHDYQHQRTLAMIEALALDYDEVPHVEDDTVFDDESIDKRIAEYIDDFNGPSRLDGGSSSGGTKRPAKPLPRAAKNPKLSSLDGIIDTIREGKPELLTVAQLKEALNAKGISYKATFKKPDLIKLATDSIKKI